MFISKLATRMLESLERFELEIGQQRREDALARTTTAAPRPAATVTAIAATKRQSIRQM